MSAHGESAQQPGEARPSATQSIDEYRETARGRYLPKGYSGHRHLLVLYGACLVVALPCLYLLRPVSWFDLATVPFLLFIINIYEYLFHRYPSHCLLAETPMFRMFFKSHAAVHHRFLTHSHMPASGDHTDLYFILFPVNIYIIGLVGELVITLVVAPLFMAWNSCLLCAAIVSLYLAFYETVHCYTHSALPAAILTVLSYIPGFNYFRHQHKLHHHPRVMNSSNYNLTFPITDWMVGTLVTELPE